MDNILKYTVLAEHEGMKIRVYLKYECNLSSRFCKSSAFSGNMFVNGKRENLSYKVKVGDEITINLKKKETQNIEPENLNLEILYEDSDILVVNKPAFMVVHPTKSYHSGTLANGLIYHFRSNGDDSIVRLVSRLDMNTTGLVIIAKNQFAHMNLQKSMIENEIDKIYLAIAHGNLLEESGTIDLNINSDEDNGPKRLVDEAGARCVTHYKVLKRFNEAQLLELRLETGRTHQIRVHLSHLGHPIFGDTLYGTEDKEWIHRQALHAYKLRFNHPRTGERMEISADMPGDMQELVDKL